MSFYNQSISTVGAALIPIGLQLDALEGDQAATQTKLDTLETVADAITSGTLIQGMAIGTITARDNGSSYQLEVFQLPYPGTWMVHVGFNGFNATNSSGTIANNGFIGNISAWVQNGAGTKLAQCVYALECYPQDQNFFYANQCGFMPTLIFNQTLAGAQNIGLYVNCSQGQNKGTNTSSWTLPQNAYLTVQCLRRF